MNNKATIYRADNEETGEVYVGTAKELSDIFGVTNIWINSVARNGTRVKGFKIEKNIQQVRKGKNYCLGKDILAEWEEVTRPFKEASRRAGGANAY